MQQLDRYITSNGKRLRCGYTTGTCAAAATRAAAELLLSGTLVPAATVSTPAGIDVVVDVEEHESGAGWACCAVRKDAGDDPDVTNGALVYAKVSIAESNEGDAQPSDSDNAPSTCPDGVHVTIDGGEGVGRVTMPGLDQPVGAAAINSTPRAMIAEQAQEAARAAGFVGALAVEISIPAGAELASHTFNPKLGIEGGISVLGTSGIVKPMSEDALIASIELELNVLHEAGTQHVLVVPGNYGRNFANGQLDLSLQDAVQCSNYLGATIDAIGALGFADLLLVGHIGKMAKVAGGIMNTHSRVADCRTEVLAAHAALAGATQATTAAIMGAATTDAVVDILKEEGLLEATMGTLMESVASRLAHRAAGRVRTEAIVFSNVHGVLGKTPGADEVAALHKVEQGTDG